MRTIQTPPTRRTIVVATVVLLGMAACAKQDAAKGVTSAAEPRPAAADVSAAPSASAAASAADPAIDDMKWAVPEPGKIGVPVDVRYEISGSALQDQPTTLNLALVPTIEGTRMRATFIAPDSLSIDAGGTELAVDNAEAASVHRRRMLVTPRQAGSVSLRVQVVMDSDGGRYVGIFTVPVSAPSSAAASRDGRPPP